jgi:hypothetical protein
VLHATCAVGTPFSTKFILTAEGAENAEKCGENWGEGCSVFVKTALRYFSSRFLRVLRVLRGE